MYICFAGSFLKHIVTHDSTSENLTGERKEISSKGSSRYTKVTGVIIRTIKINWNVVALLFV